MIEGRGWLGAILAAAACAAIPGGAGAAGADDMKACAAVGSPAVRLACFDAAAKGAAKGDVAACAKVASDAVRLACFDAAAGTPAAAPAPSAPAAAPAADTRRYEAEMRAREAAMQAQLEDMKRQAAEMERRAAEMERRAAEAAAAAAAGETAAPENPVASFGGRNLDGDAEADFGDREAEHADPLTAEEYGKSARADDEDEDDGKKEIKKIAVAIASIKEGPYGKIQVTLANGQVWKQLDSTKARWNRNGENVAHIRRAFLGSFLMTINDSGAALRVRRVK